MPVLRHVSIARFWWFIAATMIFGASLVAAAVLALKKRRTAGLLLFLSGPLVGISIWLSQFAPPGREFIYSAAPCLVCLVFGYFWFAASWRTWPSPLSLARLSRAAKTSIGIVVGFFLFVSIWVGAVAITMREPDIGDCGEGWPVSKQFPGRAVFLARGIHTDSYLGSLAAVKERFWGISYYQKLVFLKAYAKRD